jgi:membrane protease subunit HflK
MIKEYYPMAWNKPSDKDSNNPWGRKSGEQGPPDLDQIFKQFSNKMKQLFGGKTGSGFSTNGSGQDFQFFGGIALAVMFVLYIVSGIYIVDPPERAVVTRFGKYVRTEGPGPHWLPAFIESKEVVNVEQVATSDHNGLMLTRDGNIVSVGVAVQYRIGDDNDDVRAYLFNVVNPIRSLDQSAESALRQVLGQSTMDEVLTSKRSEIATAIKDQMIETLKNYHTGLRVLDVVMQFAKAPDEVRAAFDEVIKASADEERLVNQARGYENEVLPKAKGNAERLRNEALGYKQETILIAEGNVQRFNLVLPQYLKAPKVMQTRMYLDAMEQILDKTSKVVVDSGLGNNMIYLPLDRIMGDRTVQDSANTEESTSAFSANDARQQMPMASHKEKNP